MQATVILPKDLERLKLQISGVNLQKDEAKKRQEQREDKHNLSQSMVKNWENTIEGQRNKRLERMRLKQEKEEEEKLKIDKEEAKFQAEHRKEAIERAKTMLYYQTDRLKTFHSSLVLSEVLRERNAQIKFKNERKDIYKTVEDEYVRYQEELREKSRLADLEAAKDRDRVNKQLVAYQLEQISDREASRKKERERQLEEQANIEKETQQWQEKEKAIEKMKYEDKLALREELKEQLADNKMIAAQLEEFDKNEEIERLTFAEAKRNMMKMRKMKEKEILKEFQEHQEKMANRVYKASKEKVSNEDERIAKAVAEQDAKREFLEKEKARKNMEEAKSIHLYCRNKISELERERQELKELDQELLRQRIAQDQKFHANQIEKQNKRLAQMKELQEYLKAQMVERDEREKDDSKGESKYQRDNLKLMNVEENQFQQYACQVINEAKSRDSNIYPLMKAAKKGSGGGRGPVFSANGKVRPSYQPCASPIVELPTYASKDLPISQRPKDTKKRMGFTW
jgi:hypothetical protein